MSAAEDANIPLTVLINRRNTKVLFAEVDSDFTDIVLSFMTLPLGKILGLFKKQYEDEAPVVGSLSNLYRSLADLDDVYFWTSEGKEMLLNPRSIFPDDCRKLKYNLDDSQPPKYFFCRWSTCRSHNKLRRIGIYNADERCHCGELLNEEISFQDPHTVLPDGVFTARSTYNYALSDDMQLGPNVSGFIIQNIRNFGIIDVKGTEQRTVHVGGNEIMDLLRGMLLSQAPLTDLFLKDKPMNCSVAICKLADTSLQIEPKEPNSKAMAVKFVFQKSTDKFLFAQAEDDFIDFLFSLLTIPLGGVAHLLGGNTCLGSVDNLYRCIESLDIKHFKTKEMKTRLLDPTVPWMCLSDDHILPISHQIPEWHPYTKDPSELTYVAANDPKGKGCYVRRPGMFMVSNDLVVTPLSAFTIVSRLNEMNIDLFDVREVEAEIGLKEALQILKASLTSTAVLTDALQADLQKPQPKQEHAA